MSDSNTTSPTDPQRPLKEKVGTTFIERLPKNFTEVPIDPADNGISTVIFCDAAESMEHFFDTLGSMAFTPVKTDILGNIKKIRERAKAFPDQSPTLQTMVRNELDSGKHTATEGLLWLTRGLDFTEQSMTHNLTSPDHPELAASFKYGYSKTLAEVHTVWMKPIFRTAMSAAPYRKVFFEKLGSPEDHDHIVYELTLWLNALKKIVDILNKFLAEPSNKWK